MCFNVCLPAAVVRGESKGGHGGDDLKVVVREKHRMQRQHGQGSQPSKGIIGFYFQNSVFFP